MFAMSVISVIVYAMREAVRGKLSYCLFVLCVRSFSCQFELIGHTMSRDICLSLFYLTIKLYL